jgi:hydrogenase maturation protein HypF
MSEAATDGPATMRGRDGSPRTAAELARLRVRVRGAVQGVGFRPFVYRLAVELDLAGWVRNSTEGVSIEIEAPQERLESFLIRLQREKPPRAFYQSVESSFLDPAGYEGFEIRESEEKGRATAIILPDIATCPDCHREIFDPGNRRFRYPFTNCTNCGPRFSIITALPYDRANTTMQGFGMCDACRAEYGNPVDRRFHAQPNACPDCGPHLELWDRSGLILATRDEALRTATEAIRQGRTLALKGLGGFHLIVDARSEDAVRRLRQAKAREEKPLALMFPSVAFVKQHCDVSEVEEQLLLSAEAPIVLLRRRLAVGTGAGEIAPSVAPGNPFLGVMLPSTPLHHLLMSGLGFPVVATSGNRSDETICTDEREALRRLDGIADLFLVNNRPIVRHVDDSIVRISMGRELVLRRARGYAPLPIELNEPVPSLLAVGGHLKNTVAWSAGREVFVSQHIGDLETAQALDAFQRVAADLPLIHDSEPEAVACDLHPDYLSTKHAESLGLPVIRVQHHYAHILSCMTENDLRPPLLGVAWDGTGYGTDGTIWGGEFLLIDEDSFERAAHLRTFPLPGGEVAIKEPRRAALGLLYELIGDRMLSMPAPEATSGCGDWVPPPLQPGDERATTSTWPIGISEAAGKLIATFGFSPTELRVITDMLHQGFNCPRTSSVGRLFDAVAALTGIRAISRFEGQAAMELEFALEGITCDAAYSMNLHGHRLPIVIDWEPMLREIIKDVSNGVTVGRISAKFHNALAQIIVAVAERTGLKRVALSGGCFQNRYLTERAVTELSGAGFSPYWHQRIPPNDGGISLGQVVAASRTLSKGK